MIMLAQDNGSFTFAHRDLDTFVKWLDNEILENPSSLICPQVVGGYQKDGEGHAMLFIPKHAKKVHMVDSTFFHDISDPLLCHKYSSFFPCTTSC